MKRRCIYREESLPEHLHLLHLTHFSWEIPQKHGCSFYTRADLKLHLLHLTLFSREILHVPGHPGKRPASLALQYMPLSSTNPCLTRGPQCETLLPVFPRETPTTSSRFTRATFMPCCPTLPHISGQPPEYHLLAPRFHAPFHALLAVQILLALSFRFSFPHP